MHTLTREDCIQRDTADRLAGLRSQFELPDGTIYLDGNSLGVLPRATPDRVQAVIRQEWGQDLIQSWNKAGWITQPQRVGDKIGRLIGAGPGQVVATDSTSLNLYKVLSVALALVRARDPKRTVIVSERENFPTDLYIAESLARQHGFTLRLVEHDGIDASLDDTLAVLMLTQVNYRTGRQHDLRRITAAAHAAGALTVWDLAHSAGAVPLALEADDADFAVGCGYKYLNGGPGAPAFAWVHPRVAAQLDADAAWQPLAGWMGHAAPFAFTTDYRPAGGITRFLSGTPSAIALSALECGVDTVLAAEPHGGMAALREKSLALTDVFLDLVQSRCAGHGLTVQTPLAHAERGSQVSLLRDEGAYAIVQALIARGVVGDFRDPGILRFGFTPLYVRFVDVWDAVEHLVQVLERQEWRDERFHQKAAVT
ncbi:kynureninase [Achromobacter sp. GG226]|uniref:kynureninase n=1 Tax=Verticiella alkaliphila TaxID=2779529 RepID=UPI001C0AA61B|nr:kynureninase [Verticiella sp. GG226]MBU4610169.1 kynureninase [Verticiella sp. GG226]